MNEQQIWRTLETIHDPEIPVVSIVDLGIVRAVEVGEGSVTITITPTFAGCPALHVIRSDIECVLRDAGATDVRVETQLAPAWTSDWITDDARAQLKAFGLAPPTRHGGNEEIILYEVATCPRCDSRHTRLRNSFGSTLCRAIYTCDDCHETFEQFKAK